jgi:hypothetical protein
MKSIVVAALIALAFTTGFTCSKNQPAAETAPAAPTQEQMAAPTEVAPEAPAEEAAPTDMAPESAPADETK